MDSHSGNMSHWTKSTPGVTGPRPSKRDSTISLEDPFLATQEHYRLVSQSHHEHRHVPAQHHEKPALELLIPQEVYHYDPSPVPSPNVDCPRLPSNSSSADVPPGRLSPLQTYLNSHDNGERRMIGLTSYYNGFEQLPMPANEGDPRSWLTSPSTMGSSWDVVESPKAVESHPHNVESLRSGHASSQSSSWDMISPLSLRPSSLNSTALNPVALDSTLRGTLPHSFHHANSTTEPPSFASHMGSLVTQAAIQADPLEVSTPEGPFVTRGEAYLHMSSRKSTSTSPVEGMNKIRNLRKHRARLHRSRKKDSDIAEHLDTGGQLDTAARGF